MGETGGGAVKQAAHVGKALDAAPLDAAEPSVDAAVPTDARKRAHGGGKGSGTGTGSGTIHEINLGGGS